MAPRRGLEPPNDNINSIELYQFSYLPVYFGGCRELRYPNHSVMSGTLFLWAIHPFILVGVLGLEPRMFLTSRSYSPLPSPIWIDTHFVASYKRVELLSHDRQSCIITVIRIARLASMTAAFSHSVTSSDFHRLLRTCRLWWRLI